MPIKDPEKRREYDRQWKKKNIDPEKRREHDRQWRKKNPEKYKQKLERHHLYYGKTRTSKREYYPHNSYHDFETHRELAINCGIQNQREWFECFKLGLMPDGIYQNPNKAFGRK